MTQEGVQKCATCKESVANTRRYPVYVDYEKCRLAVWVEEGECFHCVEKRFSQKIAQAIEVGIVSVEERELCVDWKLFLDVYFNMKNYPLKHFENLIELLLALNIFSFDAVDNYEIVKVIDRFSMNPRQHGWRYLFFTRLSDALRFCQLKAGEGVGIWSIQYIKNTY